jgi:arylsulfatase
MPDDAFVATFDEFPPRSYPPSFNPANLLEQRLREIKTIQKFRWQFPVAAEKLKESRAATPKD